MKKLNYFVSMFAVLTLGACQNEEELAFQEQNLSGIEIAATLENESVSRIVLNIGKVYWEENDELIVCLGNITIQKATIILFQPYKQT